MEVYQDENSEKVYSKKSKQTNKKVLRNVTNKPKKATKGNKKTASRDVLDQERKNKKKAVKKNTKETENKPEKEERVTSDNLLKLKEYYNNLAKTNIKVLKVVQIEEKRRRKVNGPEVIPPAKEPAQYFNQSVLRDLNMSSILVNDGSLQHDLNVKNNKSKKHKQTDTEVQFEVYKELEQDFEQGLDFFTSNEGEYENSQNTSPKIVEKRKISSNENLLSSEDEEILLSSSSEEILLSDSESAPDDEIVIPEVENEDFTILDQLANLKLGDETSEIELSDLSEEDANQCNDLHDFQDTKQFHSCILSALNEEDSHSSLEDLISSEEEENETTNLVNTKLILVENLIQQNPELFLPTNQNLSNDSLFNCSQDIEVGRNSVESLCLSDPNLSNDSVLLSDSDEELESEEELPNETVLKILKLLENPPERRSTLRRKRKNTDITQTLEFEENIVQYFKENYQDKWQEQESDEEIDDALVSRIAEYLGKKNGSFDATEEEEDSTIMRIARLVAKQTFPNEDESEDLSETDNTVWLIAKYLQNAAKPVEETSSDEETLESECQDLLSEETLKNIVAFL